MSMSLHVEGFKPADETYKRMKAVLDACLAAKVTPPEEVRDYFGPDWDESEAHDAHGVKVTLGRGPGKWGQCEHGVKQWIADMRDGFEVDLREIDPSIKILRFYASF